MKKTRFRCRCCGKLKHCRSADQCYCGKTSCQRARKNVWRRAKYASDPDYRLNQAQSTAAWLDRQGGVAAYYREYRRRRRKQGRSGAPTRSGEPPPAPSANSDASFGDSPVVSGIYHLVPLCGANRDAISVKLSVIAGDLAQSQISTSWPTSPVSVMPRGHDEQKIATKHSHCP